MSKAAELAALIANVNKGSSLGNKNFIINGAMNVAQRGTSSTGLGAANGYFTIDRMRMAIDATSAGRYTMAQTAVTDLSGFSKSVKISCTTADTSIAASERLVLNYRFEGQTLQPLKNSSTTTKAFTVSFYARANAAFNLVSEWLFGADTSKNSQANQVNALTTSWQRFTMTIPAASNTQIDDVTTHDTDLMLWMHAGSTYTGGSNSTTLRANVNSNRAHGVSSIFASTSNFVEITGIQVEIGEKATEFEHESFSTTLSKCERYFKTSYEYGTYSGTVLSPTGSGSTSTAGCLNMTTAGNVNRAFGSIQFPIKMRDAPTMVFYAPESGTNDKARDITSNVDIGIDPQDSCTIGEGGGGVQSTGTINAVTDTLGYHYTATSEL